MKLVKEYIEAKVEIKGQGSSFKVGYDLDTNLKSVKEFKPGMYGEIITSDSNKPQDGPLTRIEEPNSPAKKGKISAEKIEPRPYLVNETIKHLQPRSKKEINKRFNKLSFNTKLTTAIFDHLPSLLRDIIKEPEYADVSSIEIKMFLRHACVFNLYEITKILIEEGRADPRDVNLGQMDSRMADYIKSQRKRIEKEQRYKLYLKRQGRKSVNEGIKHLQGRSKEERDEWAKKEWDPIKKKLKNLGFTITDIFYNPNTAKTIKFTDDEGIVYSTSLFLKLNISGLYITHFEARIMSGVKWETSGYISNVNKNQELWWFIVEALKEFSKWRKNKNI